MTDILHRVIIETSPDKLYKALTEQRGLSAWWTKVETTAKVGALASFGFGPNGDHKVDMKITELVPNERGGVEMRCRTVDRYKRIQF